MSAQALSSPKIEIRPERVQEFRKKARMDARNDPAGSENCRGWHGALKQIAHDVAQQMGGVFEHFKEQCESARKRAGESQRNIKAQLAPEFVRALDADAKKRMGNASTNILVGLRKDADLMKQYRERFPNLEERVGEPHKPNKALFVGLAIVLIALESFANSRLFAEADDFGLVGGALLAVIVSCVNVVPMLIAGIFATKSRGDIDVPLWVWRAICAGALIWAVVINIGIVAIRNQKIAEAGGLADPSQSGLLFIIGIVIAGIAFYDGWKLPDLYAKVRECQERIEREKKHYSGYILDPIEQEINKLQSAKADLAGEVDQLKDAVGQWHDNSPLIALKGISEVKRVWQIYHDEYAPLHRDPDPVLPHISAGNAEEWGVHIHEDWNAYAGAMEKNAEQKAGELGKLLEAITALINALITLKDNLVSVITAEINNACMA